MCLGTGRFYGLRMISEAELPQCLRIMRRPASQSPCREWWLLFIGHSRLWRNQEDVRKPPSEPQARQAEPGDSNPGRLLQHRGGRAIAGKKRQAHTRVAHCNGCITSAETPAPPVGEPAHHPLDQMGFYSFGQRLKPEMWKKYRNPKNSKNTRTDATTADDCGVMSLGHSRC